MKCPKCGFEIPEGQLLCEKCGAEINIVPDFEPEIENSIKESISNIIEEISPKDKKISKNSEIIYKGKKWFLITAITVVVLIVVLIIFGIFQYTKYSSSYQLRSALDDYDKGKYSKALEHVDNFKRLRPNDNSIIANEANIYYAMGDSDKAINLLQDAINNRKLDFDEKMLLYISLMNIYVAEEDFVSINNLLISSNDPRIMDQYPEMISMAPTFNIPTGNYSEVKNLEISTPYTGGEIRYTLDGSIPDGNTGFVYTKPISLRPGEYEFNAVYINIYGVESEVSKSFYLIDLEKPEEPLISPESGTYNEPIIIDIEYDKENSEVYYTVDGKNPDPEKEYTLKYNGKLTVPLGHFNYCFITVGNNGLMSDIVRRSYNVDMKSKYTVTIAKTVLINELLNAKYIIDDKCTAPGGTGSFDFIYIDVVEINNVYFYRYKEHLNAGINSGDTGTYYAVEVSTGVPYKLTEDGLGNFGLIPIR